jgi:photosystem II stability/assembly factor-like uncharacterized protein
MNSPAVRRFQVLALLSLPLAGCGNTEQPRDEARCAAWEPSAEAWSSLPTSRPASMSSLSATAGGDFLYGVGSWIEAGEPKRGVFRSSDLGTTWCLMPDPERPSSIAASPASADYLYATRAVDDGGALELVKTSDAGVSWTVAPLPVSGATLSLSAQDPNVLVAAAFNDSPWISRDAGDSWTPIALPTELEGSVYIFPPVFDPASPEHLVAFAAAEQQRVFVTTDAGGSWQESFPAFGVGNVVDGLAAGPNSALYAWSDERLTVSNDWGQTWFETGPLPTGDAQVFGGNSRGGHSLYVRNSIGLWRSDDAGANFEALTLPNDFEPLLVGLPEDQGIIGQVPGALMVSVDAGQSWSQRPLVPTRLWLQQSPVEPWPLWSIGPDAYSRDGGISWQPSLLAPARFIVPDGKDEHGALAVIGPAELKRTADGGKTWSAVPVPADVDEIQGLAPCRAPSDCLYLLYARAGRPQAGSALASDIARSLDGGRNWQPSLPVPTDAFYNPNAFVVAPDKPEQLVASGGPGLVETRDAGRSWTNQELPGVARVGSVLLFPGGVRLLASENLGVPADVVLRSTDDGASWSKLDVAPGKLFLSHAWPDTVILFGSSVSRSDDRGATWSRISPENLDVVAPYANVADTPAGKFIVSVDQFGFVSFD